ncbi:MAG: methionine synthase [Syntrophobacterales bacterium]|nr:MAG: methionine synthase [Syntrophobacterales bacterium]
MPRDRILKRLRYRKGVTRIVPEEEKSLDDAIAYGASLVRLQGAGQRLNVDVRDMSRIRLETGSVFESEDLGRFLNGCREIFLVGATGGSDIVKAIREDTERDNMKRSVVLDAVASEMVDASLDWLCSYFGNGLKRENKYLSRQRFSAGYGDFSLRDQTSIYDLLELNRIGIDINESFILVPEKSVTAVVRIENG